MVKYVVMYVGTTKAHGGKMDIGIGFMCGVVIINRCIFCWLISFDMVIVNQQECNDDAHICDIYF